MRELYTLKEKLLLSENSMFGKIVKKINTSNLPGKLDVTEKTNNALYILYCPSVKKNHF